MSDYVASSSSYPPTTSPPSPFEDWQALPLYILFEIFNNVEDAKDVARLMCVCKDWRTAGYNVKSVRITIPNDIHERARNDPSYEGKPFKEYVGWPIRTLKGSLPLKDVLVGIIRPKLNLLQLRIEVDAALQSKSVQEVERRRTDFWLTDSHHLGRWLPSVGRTLVHLCIVDYGQQAIMRRSKIVKLLSENCPHLKTLDLRNLFVDTSDCSIMKSMENLTLRCVKVISGTLEHLNFAMPNLRTLALLGVFGAEGGNLKFKLLTVLCLGLSTPATDVILECPELLKLQLKMQCPRKLIIRAHNLKYVAFNMDVMDDSSVEMFTMTGLRELLYGATSFVTLTSLVEKNMRSLQKVFVDIPCMALAEDGTFLGVLKDTTLLLPSFSKLHECEKLDVLNIGPGLWYSMETQVGNLQNELRWPIMKELIVHMIPHDMEAAINVLQMLLRVSVTSLVVFIHKSSPMTKDLMSSRIVEAVEHAQQESGQEIELRIDDWDKHLDFTCFSF